MEKANKKDIHIISEYYGNVHGAWVIPIFTIHILGYNCYIGLVIFVKEIRIIKTRIKKKTKKSCSY